jgi:hypothetical protein
MREPDESQLEESLADHHIGAGIFMPFVIIRLREEAANQSTLSVVLRNVDNVEERQRTIRLVWNTSSVPTLPAGVQEHTITEWAACGVACAILSLYTGLRVRSVAEVGDRFDYWVGDGEYEYGLEVSGTMAESEEELEGRHRVKVRQLLENPYGVDGYVIVVGFTMRQIILSFHHFEENQE